MNDWQDISTAPKDGTKLLLCNEIMTAGIGFWDKFSKCWRGTGGEQPTHWMLLPSPPQAHSSTGERYHVAADGLPGSCRFCGAPYGSLHKSDCSGLVAPASSTEGKEERNYAYEERQQQAREIQPEPSPGEDDKEVEGLIARLTGHHTELRGDAYWEEIFGERREAADALTRMREERDYWNESHRTLCAVEASLRGCLDDLSKKLVSAQAERDRLKERVERLRGSLSDISENSCDGNYARPVARAALAQEEEGR